MTLTEFLLARIAEDEELAAAAAMEVPQTRSEGELWGVWLGNKWYQSTAFAKHAATHSPARVLAECEAKRRIVELHKSWPVLVEGPPKFDQLGSYLDTVAMRLSRQITWLTEQEYRKRFGSEPPTTPILAALALPYADHPDYDPSWRP